MKKFISFSFSKIVTLSACLVLLIQLAAGFAADAKANAAFKNGSLVSRDLAVEDFAMESLVERKSDGVVKYVATDTDPQLLYTVDGLFANMAFYMENSMPGTEIVVYYTTAENQGFSEKQRLWAQPVKGAENWYSFEIPVQYVHTLRIDPTVTGGSFLTFGDFALNKQYRTYKTTEEFMGFTAIDVPFFLLYTGLLASIIRFIQDLFTKKSE